MSEMKTQPTGASVARFISELPDPVRRGDSRTLVSIMTRVTGAKPEMWGPSIVGFGRFHYRYSTGREGDWFLAGFSPSRQNLTVYVMGGLHENAALVAKLGKHKASSGGCLYLKRLAEVDLHVLETLIARSAATLRAMETTAKEVKVGRTTKTLKPARPVTKPRAVTKVSSATGTSAVTRTSSPAKTSPAAKTRPARAPTTARRAR